MSLSEPLYLLLILLLVPAGLLLRRRGVEHALFLGLLPLALLSVALAGPHISSPAPGVHTVYLIDGSASIEEQQFADAISYISEATAGLSEPDSAGIYIFGGDQLRIAEGVNRPAAVVAALRETTRRRAELDDSRTDLRAGLRQGRLSLPENGRRRLVVISDGVETEGSGAAEASLLREEGIGVSTVLLPRGEATDPRLVSVDAPRRVEPSEIFEIAVTVEGVTEDASVELFREGELLGRDDVELSGAGRHSFRYRLQAKDPGFVDYTARLIAEGERLTVNNSGGTIVEVRGPRPVLYLAENGDEESRPFQLALEAQGVPVERRKPESVSGELLELTGFDAIVIDGIPASRFSLSGMRGLERYVRDTGGGLITLGGPTSYGAGGYGQTPLEEALPVSVDVTSKVQVPTLAMLFLVDKSGSMGSSGRNVSKLDIVKEALLSSVEVMQPNQLVGLLSFDADVEWSVPITRASEREEILRNVARLQEGGGTILSTAMTEAARELAGLEAATKHLIILSDGLTREANFPALTAELRAAGATVSTASIGSDADRGLMESIAIEGGGRYYHTDDSRGIPRIFTRETSIVARNVVLEETFFPLVESPGDILSGIDNVPPLRGFVLTYPKGSTRQLINAPEGHPLLATWQYGLGRSAAFTSSIDGIWGAPWVSWELLPRLAGQLIGWTRRPPGNDAVELAHRLRPDGVIELSLSIAPNRGLPRNALDLSATVSSPDGEAGSVPLRQEGPGRYQGEIVGKTPGSYVVTVHEAQNRLPPALFPLYRSYGKEYELHPPDPAALRRVARAGGGAAVTLGTGVASRRLEARESGRPETSSADRAVTGTPLSLVPHLMVAAMLLFAVRILLEALRSRRRAA